MWYNFRKKAQYCYKNLTTGDIQWQYPKPPSIVEEQSIASGDDEMDICTTPPPNENEILASHTDQTQNGNFYLYQYTNENEIV